MREMEITLTLKVDFVLEPGHPGHMPSMDDPGDPGYAAEVDLRGVYLGNLDLLPELPVEIADAICDRIIDEAEQDVDYPEGPEFEPYD